MGPKNISMLIKSIKNFIRQILSIFMYFINKLSGKQNRTHCHWLWDEVFINEHGDVYSCCHTGIGIIGNIYAHDLRYIWSKSVKLKLYRWLSLRGLLSCFWECSLLSHKEKSNIITIKKAADYPKRVHIEYGTFCNFRCRMCQQDHKSKIALDNEALRKNIDWTLVEEVVLQGGEILAMESGKELYRFLTEQLKVKVNLITNGVLIDDEWADRLMRGSNWVEISVNAFTEKTYKIVNSASTFDRVIGVIKLLVALKQKYKSGTLIRFHFTIIPANIHEIASAIQLADDLGCDIITYSYDILSVPSFLKKNERMKEDLKKEIYNMINKEKLKIKIRGNHLEQLGLISNTDHRRILDNFP